MRTTILALILLMSAPVWAEQTPTTATQIRAATSDFLEHFAEEQAAKGYKVTFEPSDIDNRLALAPCSTEPEVSFTGDPWQSPRPSLQVTCNGSRPWRMYTTPSVSIEGPAVVASRAIARGERVQKSMVQVDTITLNDSHRGFARKIGDVAGMVVRRPINAGSPVTPDLLEAPNAVSRGDHVIIVAKSGSFSVTSRGKALADAAIGEQVLVENLRSSRTIKANVVAPGRVEVPM
ncbi:flagella basal body P-ring formation protein FlgA [Marinobacter santoriniensis NKSG1]|uniref:Flagella basal body P-ring formation protein FlgA n=2 Tax=Marinobacter santoriniensis TaxID=523742 RepID=M7CSX4_9GAMM|nr:flagella basal body P-ring formation protein FlgA [Marinobacter santoriniensis NKSG1]